MIQAIYYEDMKLYAVQFETLQESEDFLDYHEDNGTISRVGSFDDRRLVGYIITQTSETMEDFRNQVRTLFDLEVRDFQPLK